jgi:phenylacetate-CoA ligase
MTPEGKRISGEYFHLIIIKHDIQGIKEFQIVQESKEKITVNIVPNQNEKTEDINRFIDIIQKEFGEKVEIELKYLDSINRTASGKFRHIISKVDAFK